MLVWSASEDRSGTEWSDRYVCAGLLRLEIFGIYTICIVIERVRTQLSPRGSGLRYLRLGRGVGSG
jgi:hypothetical protein